MASIHDKFCVDQDQGRLDRYLAELYPQHSRSAIKTWIQKGEVRVNQEKVKASYRLEAGDWVCVDLDQQEDSLHLEAEAIDLDIVYEDASILVVNKAQGQVVHPSPGHQSGTLVNALLYHCDHLSDCGESFRPGIVHRIDKDTSGLLVVAKTNQAHQALSQQIQAKTLKREYLALVYGQIFERTGTIDAGIRRHPVHRTRFEVAEEGRPARTHFRSLKQYAKYSLLALALETGRTHQIRVHLDFIGHPVVDDPLYARDHKQDFFDQEGQLLHAHRLILQHPVSGEEMSFEAELPEHFKKILASL
ncbi:MULTISPECIES: RluA family pseudouridine synthase [Aerococcus]|uniref:Pseudouridine synthase n=1 Tax=Aerococcus sanguinicola TaxID=119206 RepID=A0A5N1GNL2_9LACT|nr:MULTISPECIES: RluA family pseudouridine synthase [Aerococcus]KAA9301994.1 RluA family pseudouridine synthase [Aerococcus sanguinicola]MDK6368581.1 RluA family pseudouridine synthase [Aerococcus sp. UMB9870]MDK6679664.1 RluA family pseudouridine synthase [Aerococcus sp. UMB8608]MDK6686508.1 RluA family pseudouridine synthase [Aerococcus sp. UMB8623]MDK6940870.1 RluA family pseudouridine synthase [Aerococcus sp. UMB8487]